MRIALVTCKHPPVRDEDIDFLLPALKRRGAVAEPVVWDDPRVDWSGFDAALVSSTWDYHERPADFAGWIGTVAAATTLHNPPGTLSWNLDKRYLRELERGGVPTVPTIWTEPGREEEIERTVAELGWSDVVLKPVVDLGAQRLARVETALVGRILRALDEPGMAQPFLPALETEGELSLVYLGGELAHAIRKRPAPGDFRVQSQYGGTVEPAQPPAEATALAEAALGLAPGAPLYARADLVRDERGQLRLIELELLEPNLFLARAPRSAERLAQLLLAA